MTIKELYEWAKENYCENETLTATFISYRHNGVFQNRVEEKHLRRDCNGCVHIETVVD